MIYANPTKIDWKFSLVFLLFLVLPFGTATHSFASILLLLGVTYLVIMKKFPWVNNLNSKSLFTPLIYLAALAAWLVLATWLNSKNTFSPAIKSFFGYSAVFVLPWLATLQPELSCRAWTRFKAYLPFMLVAWAAVAITQQWLGWSLMRAYGENQNFRPHGFYSHPLSLAYVAFLIAPYTLVNLARNWRSIGAWLSAVSCSILLLTTNSRTCLAIVALISGVIILVQLKGRQKWLALFLASVTAIGVLATPNRVSDKIFQTLSTQGVDKFSDYPDDRVAFWHAHMKMIQERPWLGHGVKLDKDYRHPYYQMIGLEDFKKQYSAHNQYIQILANGGIVGLLLFFGFMLSLIKTTKSLKDPFYRFILQLSFLAFFLGLLTQNAYDDAVVRYTFALLLSLLYTLLAREHTHQER